MSISAIVIADSISPQGIRLPTWEVVLPRCMLAEMNTHKALSRNYRSSRAVPVKKLIEEVRTNPYEPVEWRKNQRGMQAGELMTPEEVVVARTYWRHGAILAAQNAELLAACELHKQWANRPIEPYLYVPGVVTATDLANFFALRDHKDAQPEMRDLAQAMKEALEVSTPKLLQPGEWHVPYVTTEDWEAADWDIALIRKISAARCARVSYKTHDGRWPTFAEDVALYDRLVTADLVHASPLEHIATPDELIWDTYGAKSWKRPHRHGNLTGWIQFRKTIANEAVRDAHYASQQGSSRERSRGRTYPAPTGPRLRDVLRPRHGGGAA